MSYFDILAARAGAGGGAPTPQPVLIEKSVTQNGTYTALEDEADGYSSVSVEVPNTYSANDEGKVVSNGALVTQTATSTTTNGTIDTTTNNSVTVSVPNSYTAQDEGKVVSNGALVAQGSDTVTENGTVDTTLISSLTVNVSASGGGAAYYTTFPRTSSAYGKLGFGIVGNKGEQGTIFMVNTDGVSPDSTSYNTVQLNDLNLSDYLSQDKTVTMYSSSGNYFHATFDIENNAIVFSKGNFMSTNTGYYAACVSTTL